jgi:hypothetical protein
MGVEVGRKTPVIQGNCALGSWRLWEVPQFSTFTARRAQVNTFNLLRDIDNQQPYAVGDVEAWKKPPIRAWDGMENRVWDVKKSGCLSTKRTRIPTAGLRGCGNRGPESTSFPREDAHPRDGGFLSSASCAHPLSTDFAVYPLNTSLYAHERAIGGPRDGLYPRFHAIARRVDKGVPRATQGRGQPRGARRSRPAEGSERPMPAP